MMSKPITIWRNY